MPQTLLSDLQARGITFFLIGETLKTRGTLTDLDRERIRRHKAELVSLLRKSEAEPTVQQLPDVEPILPAPVSVAAIRAKLTAFGCHQAGGCRHLDFVNGPHPIWLCMAPKDRSVNIMYLEQCPNGRR